MEINFEKYLNESIYNVMDIKTFENGWKIDTYHNHIRITNNDDVAEFPIIYDDLNIGYDNPGYVPKRIKTYMRNNAKALYKTQEKLMEKNRTKGEIK